MSSRNPMKSDTLSPTKSAAARQSAEVQKIDMQPKGSGLVPLDANLLQDVQVALQVALGSADLSVAALLALQTGSVVKLGVKMTDLVELRLNGVLVARGEIVAVDDSFGVRIVEISRAT